MAWAGMAANIVGGELQGWAAVLERNAMFDRFKQQQAQQQEFRQRGENLFNTFTQNQGADFAKTDLKKSAADRANQYADVLGVPMAISLPYQESRSPKRDVAWANMRAGQRATIGSYGDWALHRTLNDIQNREAIRMLTDQAAGQASLFPYQMYQAQHSQDTLAMIGAAISSIGGGAANYAQYAQGPQQAQQGPQGPYPTPGNSSFDPSRGPSSYGTPYWGGQPMLDAPSGFGTGSNFASLA